MQKRKSLGKVLAGVATLLTMFAIAPLTARAETITGKVGTLNYSLDMDTGTIVYSGSSSQTGYQNWLPDRQALWVKHAKFEDCSVASLEQFFWDMSSLETVDFSGLTWTEGEKTTKNMQGLFKDCESLKSVNWGNLDTCGTKDMSKMFFGCSSLEKLDLSGFDTLYVTNMAGMFYECSSLEKLDLSSFDTSNVTDMTAMFYDCSGLKSLDVSSFNTSNVISMCGEFNYDTLGMFAGCSSLTDLDLSGFDTAKLTDMSSMFSGCKSLETLDVSNFDTSHVINMRGMFNMCESLKALDITGFDTSLVLDMVKMFTDCHSIVTLDLSEFDTSNVISMQDMFYGCESLRNLDVTGFNTSAVADMSKMFKNCYSMESIDLNSFHTANVTTMESMFEACQSIENLDLSSFDTSKVNYMKAMFYGCKNLISLDVSNFDASQVIDMGDIYYDEDQPYYFNGIFELCDNLIEIKSMKVTPIVVQCLLPNVFCDQDGKETREITEEFAGKVLLKKGAVSPGKKEQVKKFVSRMYTVALNREAEDAGLNDWTNKLFAKEIDGADIAEGFILSREFTNRNLSDEEYVKILYRTFFDREADEEGRATWIATLAEGKTRKHVLAGFVNSVEFENLCNAYGIIRGTMVGEDISAGTSEEQPVKKFVMRMYTEVLNRAAEEAGLNDWVNKLLSKEIDGAGIAQGFILSEEFTNRNLSDERYVDVLYRTFFNREPDTQGSSQWNKSLQEEWSRKYVLAGFVNSTEFDNLCNDYGILRGNMPSQMELAIEDVVRLVNEERSDKGLAPLSIDATINQAAAERAKELEDSFSHTRPNGSSCFTALTEVGFSYLSAGENIAFGQSSPKEVVEDWMNSPGHYANIMGSFSQIGVGYYVGADGRPYWVQLFAN